MKKKNPKKKLKNFKLLLQDLKKKKLKFYTHRKRFLDGAAVGMLDLVLTTANTSERCRSK